MSGERHRGKKRLQSTTLKGRDRVTANEANIGTDVKATLKNLLQDRVDQIRASRRLGATLNSVESIITKLTPFVEPCGS